MKNQSNNLKKLAKLAKKRLKSQEDLLMPPNETEVLQNDEERALAEKIMDLLKYNYDTPAPLMALIDKAKFEAFSPLEREIYIFNLIDKYNYYKDWYDKGKRQVQ